MTEGEKYPEGHFIGQWIGIGIAIGAGLGVPLSFAIGVPGLIGIGLPIGMSIGIAIGTSLENKAKAEGKIRPLTDAERKRKHYAVYIGVALLLMGLVTGMLFYLMVK